MLDDLLARTDGWTGLEALRALGRIVSDLNLTGLDDLLAMVEDQPEDDARDALGVLLALVDQTIFDLTGHRNSIERRLLSRLDYDTVTPLRGLDGWSVRKMGGSTNVTWDDGAAAGAVAAQFAVNTDTGEIDSDRLEIVRDTLRRTLEVAAVGYWRVGALKALGIDPDKYRTKGKSRYSVKVYRPEETSTPGSPEQPIVTGTEKVEGQ